MKMKKLIILILALITSVNYAQIGGALSFNDPVSSSMGNTSAASSRGVYAIHRNPANLGLTNSTVEVATVFPIPNIAVNLGTDFMSISQYNYYFSGENNDGNNPGRYLTAEDKAELKDLFSGGGNIFTSFSLNYLNITINPGKEIGTFAFSVSDNISASFNFPQGVIDLAVNGNPVGSIYDFNDASLSSQHLRDYTFSFARDISDLFESPLKSLSVGFSVKYVQGFAMAKTDQIISSIQTNGDNTIDVTGKFKAYAAISPDLNITYDFDSTSTSGNANYSPFLSPAGSGMGFDFGITGQWEFLTVGLAVNNIGSVTWDKNIAVYESDFALSVKDITDSDALDSLSNLVKMNGKYYEGSIKTSLPTVLRVGVSAQLDQLVPEIPGTLLVSADIIKGFNTVASNSDQLGLGLGLEWRPISFIPIMTGLGFGNGRASVAWSAGTGLDVGTFEFIISANNFGAILQANDAKEINLSFGSRWRF
jgi:hypothetical protein